MKYLALFLATLAFWFSAAQAQVTLNDGKTGLSGSITLDQEGYVDFNGNLSPHDAAPLLTCLCREKYDDGDGQVYTAWPKRPCSFGFSQNGKQMIVEIDNKGYHLSPDSIITAPVDPNTKSGPPLKQSSAKPNAMALFQAMADFYTNRRNECK